MRAGLFVGVTMLIVLLPSLTAAADIYGRIWTADMRNVAGAPVTVSCGMDFSRTTSTDRNGFYRLYKLIDATECTIKVNYQNRDSTGVPIYISGDRTRVNLELRAGPNRWSLIRR